MLRWQSKQSKFILSLMLSSLVSIGLFGYSAVHDHSLNFDYLSWNLLLAWLPLLFAIRLTLVLRKKLWSSWEALSLSVLWIIFLPNSFYMISDLIHLQTASQVDLVYDAVLVASFVYTGVSIGFSSLFLIHLHLRRRFLPKASFYWIAFTLFICSVAIYFGRDLRWSSWDVLTNPGGLLVDIFERTKNITHYPEMVITIIAFFVLLCTMYNLIWQGAHLFAYHPNKNLETD
jgi:uncharacterized membrane protein